MIKINLLSEGRRPTAVRKARAVSLEGQDIGQWLLVAGLILGIGLTAVYWYVLSGKVEEKRQEIADAQEEVNRLADVIKEVDDYKAKKAELERKIGIINDLKLNQRGPVRVMDHVSRALPELLWLDRMTMNAAVIEVEGRAFNHNAIAAFMDNLDKVPEFEEPTLKDSQAQPGGIQKFVINFNYSFAPPAAAADNPEAAAGGESQAAAPTAG